MKVNYRILQNQTWSEVREVEIAGYPALESWLLSLGAGQPPLFPEIRSDWAATWRSLARGELRESIMIALTRAGPGISIELLP
ncbi:MAG TPA: hypothetical protein PLB91_06880 [Spirochaetales bacterium]|nr:hypothetical protein [Spirochaetales bacterium]HRY52986.1 hypothetical protein [Spirochaetia bacterium]HRZ66180.1 hypothetical protein [Spirochaetia bacterium]